MPKLNLNLTLKSFACEVHISRLFPMRVRERAWVTKNKCNN